MWLPLVLIGYFFNAVAAVIDKFLLTKKITNAAVYVFYIALLGLLVWLMAPWGWYWPGWRLFGYDVLAGLSFATALYLMFLALAKNEASRVMPAIGGLSPLFVFFFSFLLFGEILTWPQVIAFALIVLGTILIAGSGGTRQRRGQWLVIQLLLSALLYGFSYAFTKYIFLEQGFVSAFILIRIGVILGALLLLVRKDNLRAVLAGWGKSNGKIGGLFLAGQAAGALSFILVNYAIALGSVTLVNALQGVQYVFLLLIVLLLARRHPRLLAEKLTGAILWRKILATALIIFGLIIIA